jgi:anti-sigma regulatory factor (Ser/Thr protein kinase)
MLRSRRFYERAAVAAHTAAAGLPRQRVYDVVTVAHELAANAIRHGAGHGRLRLWADGRSLHCQVRDDGPADQDASRLNAAAWNREHGHGLWLIDQVADQVSLDRNPAGSSVTVAFIIGSAS